MRESRARVDTGSPGTLTIAGTIFFDGKIEIAGNTWNVYHGRASIYASDVITIQNFTRICGVAACDSTWDRPRTCSSSSAARLPATASSSETTPTSRAPSTPRRTTTRQNSAVNWGPVVARNLKIENNSTNFLESIGASAPGQPTSPGAGATLLDVAESYVTN